MASSADVLGCPRMSAMTSDASHSLACRYVLLGAIFGVGSGIGSGRGRRRAIRVQLGIHPSQPGVSVSRAETLAHGAKRTRASRRAGRASPNDQWSVHRWDLGFEALALASSLLGRHVKDFSAPRFRRSAHRAPAGGARCDRGPPPAPHHVRAARDRAPARSGGAERHAAFAPASPADRRRARDGAEARGLDALALAISDKAASPTPPRGSYRRRANEARPTDGTLLDDAVERATRRRPGRTVLAHVGLDMEAVGDLRRLPLVGSTAHRSANTGRVTPAAAPD